MGADEVEEFLSYVGDVPTYRQRMPFIRLLYGSGLRLMECLQLRVKDVDFEMRQITVRAGKGAKDRVTMLPNSLVDSLRNHLRRVALINQQDLENGYGTAHLPPHDCSKVSQKQ